MNAIFAEAAEHAGGVELPFPAVFFGVIAMGVFILLGLVTWSYRDVANRHDQKASKAKASH